LHLALLALGVQEGDAVICPTFTFAATVNAVRYCGAEPVFVDCRTADWGLDPDLLEEAIATLKAEGKRLKAVMMVHAYGIPADTGRMRAICDREGLALVEDTAGALGSEQSEGKPVGLAGTVSACSTNANKMISTGSGGFLVCGDEGLMERAQLFCNQGKVEALHYQHVVVGMNYRISNLNAALGLGQWQNLEERLKRKAWQFEYYAKAFAKSPLKMMPQPSRCRHNHWMHAVLLEDMDSEPVILDLRESGIEAVPLWKPMHLQPIYAECRAFLNGSAEKLFRQGVVLPSGFELREPVLARVVESVLGGMRVR